MSDAADNAQRELDAALAALDEERTRLAGLGDQIASGGTVHTTKDRMLTVTLNGRGDLTKLAFNNPKYRQMPPAELGSAIVDAISAARGEAMDKMDDILGKELLPGISFKGLANGTVALDQIVGNFMETALAAIPSDAISAADRSRLKGERNV
jgi:hypothetical protein